MAYLISRSELTKAIAALTQAELIDVFYEAYSSAEERDPIGGRYVMNRLVIAKAIFIEGEQADYTVFARPVAGHFYDGPYTSGKCSTCGAHICTTSGEADCPICHAVVPCT
jgi:hypothetical protein